MARSLSLVPLAQLSLLEGQEHGRTIPLPEVREFCGHFAKPGQETADGEGGRDSGIVTRHSTVAGDVQAGSWAAVCTCNVWRRYWSFKLRRAIERRAS